MAEDPDKMLELAELESSKRLSTDAPLKTEAGEEGEEDEEIAAKVRGMFS